MSTATIWVDGRLVPSEEATIHVLSHAVQRGSAVFDVLRVLDTPDGPSALGLRNHVARFDRSMNLMGMQPATSIAAIERAVAETVLANPGSNLVKLVAAWVSTPTSTIPETPVPQISIAALDATMTMPGSAPPVRATVATSPKMPSDILPPSLKVAAAYTYGIRNKMAALAEGFDEIILRTPDGLLAEAVSQSLFVVSKGDLLVPPLDVVLDGITRRMVLEVAQHQRLRTQVRGIHWDEVEEADELFLCSTTNPVLPIATLGGRSLTLPGAVTSQLATTTAEVLAGTHELSRRWLLPLADLL